MTVRATTTAVVIAALVFAAMAFARAHHHRRHKVGHSAVAVGLPKGVAGPQLFGFNDNSVLMQQTSPEAALQRSQDAGANVIRYTINWDYVESSKGQFNWHGYDPLYQSALQRNIHPILVIAFSPSWARPLDLSCGTDGAHCKDPPDANHLADWADFAGTVAERYPKAAAIEIWNEPNLIEFWHSGPKPATYAALTSAAYDAIKAKVPSMTVLGGALSNIQYDGNGSIDFPTYMKDYLAAKPKMDAFSMHDYDISGSSPTWFADSVSIARSQLDAAGLNVPIWITEMGVTTTSAQGVPPQVQATKLVDYLALLGRRPDVRAAVVHTVIPAPGDPNSRDYGFAVMNADGTPKPAYCALALARHAGLPVGCPKPATVGTLAGGGS